MKIKAKQKVLAYIVTFSLVICSLAYSGVKVEAQTMQTVKTVTENGIEYKIKKICNNSNTKVVIEYEDKKIEIVANDRMVKSTSYDYTGENFFGLDKYKVTNTKKIDLKEIEKSIKKDQVRAQYTWNSKTKTPKYWGNQYWYQYGTSSKNNTYLQIGCKAKYRIKYYKLAAGKKSACKDYTNLIKKCNKNFELGSMVLDASVLSTVLAVTVAMSVTVPLSAAITAVIAIVGGYGGAVTNIVTSKYNYLDIKDDYTIIKTYGKKV